MKEMYVLDQNDSLLTTIGEDNGLISALFREELNQLPDQPLRLTVDSASSSAQFVKEENQVVFRDKEGELRLYVIKEVDDHFSGTERQTYALCEPAFMELKEHLVKERSFKNANASVVLDYVLSGTRWRGQVDIDLGVQSIPLSFESSVDAIWSILRLWGGEFKDTITFSGNQITSRTIKILSRRGQYIGKRFEVDHDIQEIQRTVLSYPVTALYGQGASSDDQTTDFSEVTWQIKDGDPANKPKGQAWIGDEHALTRYGRPYDGKLLHREGVYTNSDIEDPETLLHATWEHLQRVKQPEVHYQLTVQLLEQLSGYEHEKVSLGDTALAFDRMFTRPIEIQARVIAIEYDLMDVNRSATVEMGQFLSAHSYDDRLDQVIREINDNRGKWNQGNKPISPDRFPDILPDVPANVEATGGFQTVQIFWAFNIEAFYVQAYELFASEVKGFLPSPETLVYRGSLNGFNFIGETNKTYYFRVRAVNYHGRASNYSAEVEASTARVVTDDILFGPELAMKLRELNKEADIIGTDGIQFEQIANDALELIQQRAKDYSDQEIADVYSILTEELEKRIDRAQFDQEVRRIHQAIKDGEDALEEKEMQLKEEIGQLGEGLTSIEKHVTTEFEKVDGRLSATLSKGEVDELLTDKVDYTTYNQKMTTINASLEGIDFLVGETSGQVDQLTGEVTDLRDISSELSLNAEGFSTSIRQLQSEKRPTTNFAIGTYKPFVQTNWTNVNNQIVRVYNVSDRVLGKEVTISCKIKLKDIKSGSEGSSRLTLQWFENNPNAWHTIQSITNLSENREIEVTQTRQVNSNTTTIRLQLRADFIASGTVEITELMVTEGKRAAAWSPAFEDLIDAESYAERQTSLDSTLEGITGKVEETTNDLGTLTHTVGQFKQDLEGFSTSIGQVSKGLDSKVDTSIYDQRQTSLNVKLDEITGKVELTSNGLGTLTNTVSEFRQDLNGFSTSVRELQAQEIGGENLWNNPNDFSSLRAWDGSSLTLNNQNQQINAWNTTEATRVRSSGGNTALKAVLTILNANDKVSNVPYTMSVWIRNNGSAVVNVNSNQGGVDIEPSGERRVSYTWTANSTSHIQFQLRSSSNLDVHIWRGQLERGNKLTGWKQPASSFVNTERYNQRETSLDATLKGITGRVSSTESGLGSVSSRVGALELTSERFNTRIGEITNELGGKVDLRGFTTPSTGDSHNGKWTRFARTRLHNRYNQAYAQIIFTGGNHGGSTGDYGSLYIRHKQQNSMGEPTIVDIGILDLKGQNINVNDFQGVVVANNQNEVLVDYYVRINRTYNAFTFTLLNNSNSSFEFTERGSWVTQQQLPSGTKHLGSSSDTSYGRISKAETTIEQNASEIRLRATRTSVDNLTGRVSTTEGSIRTMSDRINLRVEKDGIISAINISPEQVKINTSLLQIGSSDNLIPNGDFADETTSPHWIERGSWFIRKDSETSVNREGLPILEHRGNASADSRLCLGGNHPISVTSGEQYRYSIWVRPSNPTNQSSWNSLRLSIRTIDANGSYVSFSGERVHTNLPRTVWTLLEGTATIPNGAVRAGFFVRVMNDGNNPNYYFSQARLQKMHDATVIVNGSIMANHMSANSITAANGALANASITRANLQTSIITDAYIANGTIERASIRDGAIDNAKIANATITDGKIVSLSANKITAGEINAANINVVASGNGIIRMNRDGFAAFDNRNRRRILINVQNVGGIGSDPAVVRFFDPTGKNMGYIGANNENTYSIYSSGNTFIDSVGRIILRSHEFRIDPMSGSTSSRYWVIGRGTATGKSGHTPTLRPDTSGWGIVGTGNHRLWEVWTNHLHSFEQHQISTRAVKANIEKLDIKHFAELIDRVKLYSFNYKREDGTLYDHKTYGVIAEDLPFEFLGQGEHLSLNINNFNTGVLAKVKMQDMELKEFRTEIELVKDDLSLLELENQLLRRDIEKLKE